MTPNFIFYIGTSAELIKLIPVIQAFNRNNINYKIISSGQTDLKEHELAPILEVTIDHVVIKRFQNQTSLFNFGLWSLKCFISTVKEFINLTGTTRTAIIVHGDTVTSLIGSLAGKLVGAKILHVESGLRSFNMLQPFPEEICRYITSYLADIHFCPNSWAVDNLKHHAGLKINTQQNTSLEMLTQSLKLDKIPQEIKSLNKKYFLVILHRQENVMFKKKTSITIIKRIIAQASPELKCVFVMHKLTENFLNDAGLYNEILANKNIVSLSRKPYLEFIHIINNADFILTDGGSNQEETYYMGKPTLILRNVTERIEGLNENSILMKEDLQQLNTFISNYTEYRKEPIKQKTQSPSDIIITAITNYDFK